MRRPSYADVASTLALVLAMSAGGAYAADLVTSADLAKNAVTSAKIKNGQVKAKDLDRAVANRLEQGGPAGGPGPAGPQGAAGPAGPQGPRGVSAWNTIPSGTTVTGDFMDTGRTPPDSSVQYVIDVSFPAELADAPISIKSGPDSYSQTGHADATCQGTMSQPTAPPGQVCLYYGTVEAVDLVVAHPIYGRERFGFYVRVLAPVNVTWKVYGSWAYTAP